MALDNFVTCFNGITFHLVMACLLIPNISASCTRVYPRLSRFRYASLSFLWITCQLLPMPHYADAKLC